ncbi:MAG: DUF4838 domain-containing protein [Puniceicoccaceae bacterium]|nr:MAG: DUF4838 domain-containing protein [Puniceicoccaceae bacterium]
MCIDSNTFFRILFIVLLCPVYTLAEQRAQSWKPEHRPGSAELSIDAIQHIVLPADPPDGFLASLDDFVSVLEKRTGQSPTIVSAGRPKNALYFELRPDAQEQGGAFSVIRERTRVTIRSADEQGWGNALYTIAERMLGARWYWSGDLGFEWADPQRSYFPRHTWQEAPAFVQRRFHPVNTDYARRNRLNEIYAFNHNLGRVFSPQLYQEMPEVFAEINGRRREPQGRNNTDPQPDFTQAATVEVAARAALDFFEANPEASSFSLSINDNVLFDTSARTEAAVSPLRYFRGRPDYSDLVFGFMNQVAEKVFEEAGAWQTPSGKKRYLTALAYYWTEPVPSLPLHPRVMPVLTSDRAQWHDPDYRAEDKALIEAWGASGAKRIATWDYYFGAPYPYPRQFNQWITESLRFMSEAGVDVFFSQLPAFWGLDGAKPWFGAQLLWNPQQDAEALLDEYYTNFFGPAADSIRHFYETAEHHRNTHEGEADWIKLYKDESGIALFTPDVLRTMRGLLDAAEASLIGYQMDAAPGLAADRFARRIEVVSEAFQFTEYFAAFHRARRALVMACLDGAAKETIEDKLAQFRLARTEYQAYFELYFERGNYVPQRRHLELNQSDPESWALGLLGDVAAKDLVSLVDDTKLKHQGSAPRNFLGPKLPRLDGWNLDFRASEHFSVGPSAWGRGAAGLRLEGVDMLSVFRQFPVVSNRRYVLKLHAAWRVSPDNRVQIQLDWLDRDGQVLSS